MEQDKDNVGQTSPSAISQLANETSAPLFVPFDPEVEIHKTSRRLPHWQQTNRAYFVTFRLADSLPQDKLLAWMEEREIWLKHNPAPWTQDQRKEYSTRFGEKLQHYLDAGYGSCVLKRRDCARIVADALLFCDGQRYDSGDFVIMPNHVHILVKPLAPHTLSKILQAWKGFSAKEINRVLGRTGTLWMDEFFDHIVRSEDQLLHFQQYIRENPIEAGLREREFIVGCGEWKNVGQTSPSALPRTADGTSAPH